MKKIGESGQLFILAVVVIGLVVVMVIIMTGGSLTFSQNSKYHSDAVQATHLAEAGIDKAVASLNASGGVFNGEPETSLGPGSYSVVITDKNALTKKITATGFIPNKTNPKTQKTIELEISKGTGASFKYGVQVGDGGLIVGNNSRVNGSIYSNGNITLANNATITGDTYAAGGIAPIANQENDCVSPNCSDYTFGKNINGENRLDVAQSFRPTITSTINKVSLKLKKVGSPPNITVRILGDSANRPDKDNRLSSGTLYSNLVSTQYGFTDIILTTPAALQAESNYWIVIDTSSDDTNYWSWSQDAGLSYSRGQAKWSPNWQAANPSWNNINTGDMDFKVFMGGTATYINGANGVVIGGDAHANTLRDLSIGKAAFYQVSENITAQSYFPNSTDPVPLSMPLSSAVISQWKNEAENLAVTTGNITTCPASLRGKYLGNVTLPNNCTVTIVDGPVWIAGSLTLSGGNIVKLSSDYQSTSGYLIVDQQVILNNNNSIQGSGSAGSYLVLISEFNSRDDPEQKYAVDVQNNGNTGIVYANLGTIRISNNNNMTEVTGWRLQLENNVVINYDQGLATTFFSSGPSGSFTIVKGTYKIK